VRPQVEHPQNSLSLLELNFLKVKRFLDSRPGFFNRCKLTEKRSSPSRCVAQGDNHAGHFYMYWNRFQPFRNPANWFICTAEEKYDAFRGAQVYWCSFYFQSADLRKAFAPRVINRGSVHIILKKPCLSSSRGQFSRKAFNLPLSIAIN